MRNAYSYLDGKSDEKMTPVEPKKVFNRTQRKKRGPALKLIRFRKSQWHAAVKAAMTLLIGG